MAAGTRGYHAGVAIIFAALVLSEASPSFADPYEKAANEISRIAGRSSKRRIAVLPFLPVSGEDSQGSLILAERLTARLTQQGSVEIIERTLLEKVLHEQGLSYQGLIDPRQANQVGRVLGVDSVVTGTFLALAEGKLEVNARLIDAETARILGVSTMQVPQDWQQASAFSGSFNVIVPPPDIGDSGPVTGLRGTFRDAVSDRDSCSEWEMRVDEMQSTVMELKARYWASRLQEKGFSARSLTRNPGSEIRSMSLRQEFFRRVRDLYESGWRGALAANESALLETSDRAVGALMENCYR